VGIEPQDQPVATHYTEGRTYCEFRCSTSVLDMNGTCSTHAQNKKCLKYFGLKI